MIEPLYARFWDRYHEVDKGNGKYVRFDKGSLAAQYIMNGRYIPFPSCHVYFLCLLLRPAVDIRISFCLRFSRITVRSSQTAYPSSLPFCLQRGRPPPEDAIPYGLREESNVLYASGIIETLYE